MRVQEVGGRIEEFEKRRKRKEVNNVVELQVSGEKTILKIPRANVVQAFDNIVSFDSKTKKNISAGTTQEEFSKSHPGLWKKYKGRIEFRVQTNLGWIIGGKA